MVFNLKTVGFFMYKIVKKYDNKQTRKIKTNFTCVQ